MTSSKRLGHQVVLANNDSVPEEHFSRAFIPGDPDSKWPQKVQFLRKQFDVHGWTMLLLFHAICSGRATHLGALPTVGWDQSSTNRSVVLQGEPGHYHSFNRFFIGIIVISYYQVLNKKKKKHTIGISPELLL